MKIESMNFDEEKKMEESDYVEEEIKQFYDVYFDNTRHCSMSSVGKIFKGLF